MFDSLTPVPLIWWNSVDEEYVCMHRYCIMRCIVWLAMVWHGMAIHPCWSPILTNTSHVCDIMQSCICVYSTCTYIYVSLLLSWSILELIIILLKILIMKIQFRITSWSKETPLKRLPRSYGIFLYMCTLVVCLIYNDWCW